MEAESTWPRVGCGAAIIKNGKILLVRRMRAPEAGCWGLPGGKVDPFESVAAAAAREIREELGITIEPTELLCLVDQIDRAQLVHWVAAVFRVDAFAGTPFIMEPDVLSDMGWFELDNLPEPLTEATRQAVAGLPRSAGPVD